MGVKGIEAEELKMKRTHVSSNEAQPKENKKESEVSVCVKEEHNRDVLVFNRCMKCWSEEYM